MEGPVYFDSGTAIKIIGKLSKDIVNTIPIYQIKNDASCDSIYPHLFTCPGILVVRDFPLTESRFRVLRKSFSYLEIMEELQYCIGSKNSAMQLARLLIDDLFTADVHFLYPETIRVLIEASIATVVHDASMKQRLSLLYPEQRIFYLPEHLRRHMRIDQGRLQCLMPQEFLNQTQVCAVLQEMRCKGMSKGVHRCCLRNA